MCSAICRSYSVSCSASSHRVSPIHRQLRSLGDGQSAEPHVERLGLELRAAAGGALLRRLVLAQEDPDVLLVALLLLAAQERKRAHESACRPVQDALLLRPGERAPGRVGVDPLATRELDDRPPLRLVARLAPRVDGAVAQRALRVRDDEPLVVLEHRAEPVARLARAARVVEREELRRRRREPRAVVGTLVPLREVEARRRARLRAGRPDGWRRIGDRGGEQDGRVAVPFSEGGAERVGQT
jgi:hypothetical protein